MKLEMFFEKFDQFADAPDAVAKMREILVELAVTGHFFGSEGWKPTQLGEVCERIHYGYTAKAIPSLNAVRMLRITDIQNNRVHWETVPGCEISEKELPKYCLGSGDILIARTGGTVGKSFLVQKAPPTAVFASYLIRLQLSKLILPSYLKRFLESPSYWHQLFAGARGAAQPNVNGKTLARIKIPLPPLAEQKRIVEKVDELMALCDRLEAQQQERDTRHAALARASLARFADTPTPANLNFLFHKYYDIDPADLCKSILTLAVQGKLVPQDPNDEPAVNIIERVSELRGQLSSRKRAKAPKNIRDLDDAKCAHAIPLTWIWCRLGDLVLDFRYGTSRKCAHKDNGVPVLRIPNIRNGLIDSSDLKFTEMPQSEFEDLRLQAGDLLLIRSNGSENLVGRSAVATAADEQFAYAGYLVRAQIPANEVFSSYLHVALSTPSVRSQIEGPIRTTSGVKNINTTELASLVLPLPPLAEQRRIVAKVDQLMALVDELETQLAASRAIAKNLLEAIVAEVTAASAIPRGDV